MAYTRYYWQTGDVIDASKLNNIEDGISNCDAITSGIYTLSAPRFAIIPVSGNTYAAIDGDTQTPLSFAVALTRYTSIAGAFFAMVLNQDGTAYRVMTVVAASIPDQTVNLMCIDGGVLYELALQDSGSGLMGTMTTKTL